MIFKEYEKITKLVETKNDLIRKRTNISFYKTEDCWVFSNISNALYDEKNGKTPENSFASVCVKHKKELYDFIKKYAMKKKLRFQKKSTKSTRNWKA